MKMLSRLLKEHQAKQNERKELQEKRRREAIAAATCLTEALVDHLNVGVAQAYVNQRKLDHEVKTLQVQAGQFSKQTAQWISMVEGFNQALKEIGDVENWARSIEMDMRTIATALEYVHKVFLPPTVLPYTNPVLRIVDYKSRTCLKGSAKGIKALCGRNLVKFDQKGKGVEEGPTGSVTSEGPEFTASIWS
ncbi:hypothetical protein WMY93_011936 [Mugilogobius chulae]|uniref:Biogenesis of lysosome-related organelles complex 1 subunit 1 n=1 Tax=Mugilogobius chulae TaxID=88201 RepID=A0AAW0P437_9GOBI